MVVYPEAVWYTYVDRADIDEIIDSHVVNGKVVAEARHLTPKTTEREVIEGPAGPLEVVINAPAAATGIALVAHPHPQQAARSTTRSCRRWRKRSSRWTTLRCASTFAGRASVGAFDDGNGETDDALAALAHARGRFGDALPVALAGFSFGTFVQTRVAHRVPPNGSSSSLRRPSASSTNACRSTRS